jgi:hypothetical protein
MITQYIEPPPWVSEYLVEKLITRSAILDESDAPFAAWPGRLAHRLKND